MFILAIDLGKNKSVACSYDASTGEHGFWRIETVPDELQFLLDKVRPDRVVIEVCNQAGWVGDQVRAAGIELQVANTNGEAWRWQNVKRKTDRDDALKLARMSAMNQLSLVHLPARPVRQWRSLIQYRQALIARRTRIKNSIRSRLDREAIPMPSGKSAWTQRGLKTLQELARPLEECSDEEFWRGELWEELEQLRGVEENLHRVENRLDVQADADARTNRLKTIPGVGRRLSEMVVAVIDDPHRFTDSKQVASYAGLVPRQYESGQMSRQGRITGRGHRNLRKLLVEVSWVGIRYNPQMREIYERVHQGCKTRKKLAIVAVARRVLIWCWAMLRDETDWRGAPRQRKGGAVSRAA